MSIMNDENGFLGSAKWWMHQEEERERLAKEELRSHPCYNCVWFDKQALTCPFPQRRHTKMCFHGNENILYHK